jgi:hypothetical protein
VARMLPTIVQAGRMLPTVVVDAVANTSHYEFQGNAFLVGIGVEWNALDRLKDHRRDSGLRFPGATFRRTSLCWINVMQTLRP